MTYTVTKTGDDIVYSVTARSITSTPILYCDTNVVSAVLSITLTSNFKVVSAVLSTRLTNRFIKVVTVVLSTILTSPF